MEKVRNARRLRRMPWFRRFSSGCRMTELRQGESLTSYLFRSPRRRPRINRDEGSLQSCVVPECKAGFTLCNV